MFEIAVLLAASVVMVLRPAGLPVWAGPAAGAALVLVAGSLEWRDAIDTLGDIRGSMLFLVFSVPLAVALDRVGVFEAIAASFDGGRRLVAGLWFLGAAVTVVFNLDAAVVLLTPLYVRIARRNQLPVESLAFQPALLACLASHPLPVSNLTNLIVAEQQDLSTLDFARHLGPVTVVAVVVGWFAYRRAMPATLVTPSLDTAVDRRALAVGAPVIAFVLLGFTVGHAWGIPAWLVAAVALALTVAAGRVAVPWRLVPWEAIAVAGSLAVVVAAAVVHLDLDGWLADDGATGRFRALALGALGSDLTNNLPTVLAAAPSVAGRDHLWALLVGVNMAPVFVISGALSGLLWRDTCRSLGVEVSARRYAAVGLRVGGPAFVVASAMVVLGL